MTVYATKNAISRLLKIGDKLTHRIVRDLEMVDLLHNRHPRYRLADAKAKLGALVKSPSQPPAGYACLYALQKKLDMNHQRLKSLLNMDDAPKPAGLYLARPNFAETPYYNIAAVKRFAKRHPGERGKYAKGKQIKNVVDAPQNKEAGHPEKWPVPAPSLLPNGTGIMHKILARCSHD